MTDAAPFISIGERMRRWGAERPRRAAIVESDEVLDYQGLAEAMDRAAAMLAARGVRAGQVVAIAAANSIDYVTIYLGAAAAGVIVAPLAPGLAAETMLMLLENSGAALVFADRENARRLADAGCLVPVVPIDPIEDAAAPPPPPHDVAQDQPFNIIYSSGTTGRPKGIVQSHGMRDLHILTGADHGYDEDAVTLISTPLYSNTTLVSLLPALGLGGTVVLMRRFEAEAFLELAERHRVTHAMLVPVQYQRLLASASFDARDLSAFRHKFATSAPFAASLKREVLDRWPGALTEFYGLTEGGGVCALRADRHPDKLHTVGRPVAGHELRIIDDQGNELPPGESGEVVGRSAIAMQGYHKLPEATAAIRWTAPDGAVFLRTGDIGKLDEDGFLTIHDRKKDMIISGGFNVYAGDLEEVAMRCPGVKDVAVVGVPSARWGETPVAFAVAPGIEAEAIRDFVNARVGKVQRLARVVLIDALPRNGIGKVLKTELRRAYAQLHEPAA